MGDYYSQDRAGGQPVELYLFSSAGFTTPYRFTSADVDLVYASNTYTATRISRTQPEISGESNAQQLSITVPRTNALALRWFTVLPPKPVFVTIYRYHITDTPTPKVIVSWTGKITGIDMRGPEFSFICEPLDFAFSRMGLRYNFGPICSNQVYDSGCRVDPNNFSKTATVTAISGDKLTITASEFSTKPAAQGGGTAPANYWVPGVLEKISSGEARSIVSFAGGGATTVVILFPFEDLNVSDSVKVYAGCNNSIDPTTGDCINKFNNLVNAKAWTNIGDSPFSKNILR